MSDDLNNNRDPGLIGEVPEIGVSFYGTNKANDLFLQTGGIINTLMGAFHAAAGTSAQPPSATVLRNKGRFPDIYDPSKAPSPPQ